MKMPDLRIERVSGNGDDALYNVYHENRLAYAAVSMPDVLRYLGNIHEDDTNE